MRTWQPCVSSSFGSGGGEGCWSVVWYCPMKSKNHRSLVWDYICFSLALDTANSCPKSSNAYSFPLFLFFTFMKKMCVNTQDCDLCFTISMFIANFIFFTVLPSFWRTQTSFFSWDLGSMWSLSTDSMIV